MHINRSLSATAAAVLAGAALTMVGGAVSPASAACAPSIVAAPHATASKRPHIASTTTVQKSRKKKFVATVRITASQGAATVTVVQTICPDGAAGAAASTTQAANGSGTVTKAITGKGSSKGAAKRAAKAKAAKAVAAMKKAAKTRKGLEAAKNRAIAVARVAAVEKAHHALYDAKIVYYAPSPSSGAPVESVTPAPGGIAIRGASNGDLVVTIPAGAGDLASLACIRRAPAWPTNFIFDAASVSAPALADFARTSGDSVALVALSIRDLLGGEGAAADGGWFASFEADGTQANGVDGAPEDFAGDIVCVLPGSDLPAATMTIHGPRVGTRLSAPDITGLAHVLDGVPVTVG